MKPKATPPGQAKKQQPAAHSNGNAGKDKPKQAKGKSAPVNPQPAAQPEQHVAPVQPPAAANGGQPEAREENAKGPKK